MKLLTGKKQNEIEKNRDRIFDYLISFEYDTNDLEMFEKAVKALAEICFDCGIGEPYSERVARWTKGVKR